MSGIPPSSWLLVADRCAWRPGIVLCRGDVKATLVIMALIDAGAVPAAGCGASAHETGPVVILAPDEFVLRDVRKDAARYLNCQVPMVMVQLEPWAGSQGNVTAIGCGVHITYYVVCQTNHECTFNIAE